MADYILNLSLALKSLQSSYTQCVDDASGFEELQLFSDPLPPGRNWPDLAPYFPYIYLFQ